MYETISLFSGGMGLDIGLRRAADAVRRCVADDPYITKRKIREATGLSESMINRVMALLNVARDGRRWV